MKYFATFTPAIAVEFNNKRYVMHSTKKYASKAELFTALANFSDAIINTKVGILAEREDKRTTQWL